MRIGSALGSRLISVWLHHLSLNILREMRANSLVVVLLLRSPLKCLILRGLGWRAGLLSRLRMV